MKKRFTAALLFAASTLLAQGRGPRRYGSEDGFAVFQQHCTSCHGNPNVANAPSPEAIRQRTPEAILASMTDGSMKMQAESLSSEEKRRLAEYMGGRPLGSAAAGDAAKMPNRCASNPAMADPAATAEWEGWGATPQNTRFQTAKAGALSADQAPKLKLKWAFGFPVGISAFSQPAVASGRVFVGSDTGFLYSLNAQTGCVYWSYQAKAGIRNAISVGPVKAAGAKYAVYFGDVRGNAYGIDAQNGKQIWTRRVEDHFSARVTGAPKLYNGRLYVPMSSSEGFTAGTLDYPCCTFRGSVTSLDANTGQVIWKFYTIAEAPRPIKKNSKGVQLYAPAGISVWNSPTVDPERNVIYFGTGDGWTDPVPNTSDAIIALDIDTGKVKWSYQATPNDSWLGGCGGKNKSENCPAEQGPDVDFAASPMLVKLANGHSAIIAGQKSGTVYALDPDKNGAILWKTTVNATPRGGIMFGGATDGQNAYFAVTGGGVGALDLATGERRWFSPLAKEGTRASNSAAITATPGVVYAGTSDGTMYAVSTTDGTVLWTATTNRDFDTVDKVPSHGGGMGAPGPVVAGGTLFVVSGYNVTGGTQPGNVLLAYSAE